jgi:NADH-quinone oxidoreductase subunit B/C/D
MPTPRFRRLDDLTAIDESARRERRPENAFTLVYHLLAFEPATRLRLTVPLNGVDARAPSVTGIWPSAAWYEREVYDMFGIHFDGHPDLRRILMPDHWQGHPLRKSHPGRATDMDPYTQADARRLQPRDGGLFSARQRKSPGPDRQRGAAPREHPRLDPLCAGTGRGNDFRYGHRDRLPPPVGGKDR